MTVFNGADDYFVNIVFGVLLILWSVSSTLLNPVIFLSNLRNKPSNVLFRLISLADFSTNLFLPLIVAYRLMASQLDVDQRDSTLTEKILTVVYLTAGCMSATYVAILGVLRCVSIRLPFYVIRARILYASCAMFFSIALSINVVCVVMSGDKWNAYEQLALSTMDYGAVPFIIVRIKYQVNGVVSVGAALMTCYFLRRTAMEATPSGAGKSSRVRSSLTIIYLNIGNFLQWLSTIIYMSLRMYDSHMPCLKYLQFLAVCFIPMVLSGINPTIIAARSSNVKQKALQCKEVVEGKLTVHELVTGRRASVATLKSSDTSKKQSVNTNTSSCYSNNSNRVSITISNPNYSNPEPVTYNAGQRKRLSAKRQSFLSH